MMRPVIQTERLTLRPPVAADWEGMRPFAMSERSQYVGGPFDLRGAWKSLCEMIGHWEMRGYGPFVITMKGDDRGIGDVGPWNPIYWPEGEIGWTLWDAGLQGRGIAREAAIASKQWARDVLGWQTPVSYIDKPNAPSIALATRLGAVLEPDAPTPHGDTNILVYRHRQEDAT